MARLASTVNGTSSSPAPAADNPLHRQVSSAIKGWIDAGELQPGDFLPTETELEQQFGVSRITIRRAMQDLSGEGLVERRQGRGTRVREPRAAQTLNSVTSFGATITNRGWQLTSVDVSLRTVAAPPVVANDLRVANGAPVLRLQRLRLAGGQPISHQVNYLTPEIMPGLLASDLTGNVSLYELLEDRYGLVIAWADETIGAHDSSPTEAELLQITPGAAVLSSRRVSYLENGQPFESAFSTIRADCYEYTIHLSGRGPRTAPG